MPQTRVEKKFFRVRADKFLQNIAQEIVEGFAITKFQPLDKIIFGGDGK